MKAKPLKLIIVAGLFTFLFSCKKMPMGCDTGPNPPAIVTKWNIVSDSTYVGVGFNNHPIDYQGRSGDYFNFTPNGILYTKEGVVLDTLSYSLVADTGIIIGSFGINLNGVPAISHISNFTAHSITIASPVVLTPGGIFGRKVSLSR
jgi:hypothetical protein